MAISLTSTNVGKVFPDILTKITTGNDFIESGIYVTPNIGKDLIVPVLDIAGTVGPVVVRPVTGDSGTATITERNVTPADVMSYLEFDPDILRDWWDPLRTSGKFLTSMLQSTVSRRMMGHFADTTSTEIGRLLLVGDPVANPATETITGLITVAEADAGVIDIATPVVLTEANIISKLIEVYDALPDFVRNRADLKFYVSYTTKELYAEARRLQTNKGPDNTAGLSAADVFRDRLVVALYGMPDDTIFATFSGTTVGSNIWVGVDWQRDGEVMTVDRLQNNSNEMFYKMLMRYAVALMHPEYCVLYKV